MGFRLYGVHYGYSDVPLSPQEKAGLSGPTWPALSEGTWSFHSRVARKMLPVAHIRIDDLAPGEPGGSLSVPSGGLQPDRPGADLPLRLLPGDGGHRLRPPGLSAQIHLLTAGTMIAQPRRALPAGGATDKGPGQSQKHCLGLCHVKAAFPRRARWLSCVPLSRARSCVLRTVTSSWWHSRVART